MMPSWHVTSTVLSRHARLTRPRAGHLRRLRPVPDRARSARRPRRRRVNPRLDRLHCTPAHLSRRTASSNPRAARLTRIPSPGRLVRTGYIEEMVNQNRTRQSFFKYINQRTVDFPLPVSTEVRTSAPPCRRECSWAYAPNTAACSILVWSISARAACGKCAVGCARCTDIRGGPAPSSARARRFS